MGKASPFEGELDAFGNPCCGQSFMAGTICTDAPGHSGSCSTLCQGCGYDGAGEACSCYEECSRCEDWFAPDHENQGHCSPCLDELRQVPHGFNHDDYVVNREEQGNWCDTSWAIGTMVFMCRRSRGHQGVHGCGGADSKRTDMPLTDAELAEVHRSLLGTQ